MPETLEPSLQLASAVLSQLNMPPDDVQEAIQDFRRAHMGELQVWNRSTLSGCDVALKLACLGMRIFGALCKLWQSAGSHRALPRPHVRAACARRMLQQRVVF